MKPRERKQNVKMLEEYLFNQTPAESDEERIREEHITFGQTEACTQGRAKAYRMMMKEQNKIEIYKKNAENYVKKYKRLVGKSNKRNRK